MADQVPGVYTSFDRDSDVSGTAPNNRCLIHGLVPAGSLAPVDVPFLATSLDQVEQQCGGVPWSQMARNYQAAKAQPESVGAEIWCLPVADPAGTSGTRLIKFMAEPTYDSSKGWILGTATAAAAATEIYIDCGGQVVNFSVPSGTTWAACATLAQAALAAMGAELVYAPSLNSQTVTLTDRHASAVTDDLPIRVWSTNPAAGVGFSMGTLTYATAASGDGVASLTDGIHTASAAVTNGDAVTVTATSMRNSINTTLPARAALADPATGVVTLFYLPDRYVRRLTADITAAGTTSTLAAGTAGAGTPSLTSALTYLAGESTAYKCWALAQADATALGAVAAHVIAQDATPIEKGQQVFVCISSALPGTSLITSPTPSLGTTELMTVMHAQGATVPAAQLAARAAVVVAAEDDHGRNYNGLRLVGTEIMPLAAPHRKDRSGRDAWNAAISGGYAPVAVDDSGRYYVVHARTTWLGVAPSTRKLKKWSGSLLPKYFRADMRITLHAAYFRPGNGMSLKANGQPMTDRGLTQAGVKSLAIVRMKAWDNSDYFDYSSDLNKAVTATVSGGRVALGMPFRSVEDLDRIEVTGFPA